MEKSNKIYCGIAKARSMGEGDKKYSILKVTFSPEHLKEINAWASSHDGWVTVDISKRKSPSDKGVTHTVSLDTWEKPPIDSAYTQDNLKKLKDTFNASEVMPDEITEEPMNDVPF